LNPEIRANEKDGSKVPTRRSQQEVWTGRRGS
jgi:hypothetical protein